MRLSIKSLIGALVVLTSAVAHADSTTSVPAFEAQIAAARTTSSPGGSAVIRQEISAALNQFLSDDGKVDANEHAYLATKVNDATFLTNVTGSAKKFLTDFYELNDAATTAAPLGISAAQTSTAELFGTDGVLARNASVQEGYIPSGQGVANQITLATTYYNNWDSTGVGAFTPITPRELIDALKQSFFGSTATADEIDGVVAYITQISRNSNRLYMASWINTYGRGAPGDVGGFVIAAVSTDRRFVRYIEFTTWAE